MGGTSKDIQNRINKAHASFIRLRKIWNSKQYTIKTKLRLYESCVISTLLWCRVLENHRRRPAQTLHLSYNIPSQNPTHLLAQNHLQQEATQHNPARRYAIHLQEAKMDLDRPCTQNGKQRNSKSRSALDPRGQKEEGEAKDDMAPDH